MNLKKLKSSQLFLISGGVSWIPSSHSEQESLGTHSTLLEDLQKKDIQKLRRSYVSPLKNYYKLLKKQRIFSFFGIKTINNKNNIKFIINDLNNFIIFSMSTLNSIAHTPRHGSNSFSKDIMSIQHQAFCYELSIDILSLVLLQKYNEKLNEEDLLDGIIIKLDKMVYKLSKSEFVFIYRVFRNSFKYNFDRLKNEIVYLGSNTDIIMRIALADKINNGINYLFKIFGKSFSTIKKDYLKLNTNFQMLVNDYNNLSDKIVLDKMFSFHTDISAATSVPMTPVLSPSPEPISPQLKPVIPNTMPPILELPPFDSPETLTKKALKEHDRKTPPFSVHDIITSSLQNTPKSSTTEFFSEQQLTALESLMQKQIYVSEGIFNEILV